MRCGGPLFLITRMIVPDTPNAAFLIPRGYVPDTPSEREYRLSYPQVMSAIAMPFWDSVPDTPMKQGLGEAVYRYFKDLLFDCRGFGNAARVETVQAVDKSE